MVSRYTVAHAAKKVIRLLACLATLISAAQAIDNLKLNPKLDYNSDRQDGPLITGEHAQAGVVKGKVNYIIIFEQG
jgi:hypothetical protein